MSDLPFVNTPDEHSVRLLYALYTALAREYGIDLPPCHELETSNAISPEELTAAKAWLHAGDDRIAVHQLRQFLQTSSLANQATLQAALEHYLRQTDRGQAQRDKVDFLLVQYLSVCGPSPVDREEPSLEQVADILTPVLGKAEPQSAESLGALEELLCTANQCHSLQEVFSSGVLEKGRSLKAASGDAYFTPPELVAYARFNFSMRRVFFRLMHQELNVILDGLRQLELRGIESLDCRNAEFSAEEPVLRLRMICQSWKVMFQAEYAFGQPLRILADLRAVIDAAMQDNSASQSHQVPAESSPSGAAWGEVTESAAGLEPQWGKTSEESSDSAPHSPAWGEVAESAGEAHLDDPKSLAKAAAASSDASEALSVSSLKRTSRVLMGSMIEDEWPRAAARRGRSKVGTVHGIDHFRRRRIFWGRHRALAVGTQHAGFYPDARRSLPGTGSGDVFHGDRWRGPPGGIGGSSSRSRRRWHARGAGAQGIPNQP